PTDRSELLSVATDARLAKKDAAGAEAAVGTALKEYPDSDELLGTAARIFMHHESYPGALKFIEQQLKIAPDHVLALRAKGYVCLQLGQFAQAIEPLTRALNLEPNGSSPEHYMSLLNRA